MSADARNGARWLLAAVISGAVAIRALALWGMSGLPFLTHHRLDAKIYHEAGVAIAGGQWGLGDGVLHMSPGYSYFVGAIYFLFGDGPWPIRGIQIAMGVGTVVLIYRAALLVFESRRWAFAAGAVAALYGPFVFYDINILAASLAAFCHALVLWLALRGMSRNRVLDWAAVGAAWAAAILVRPTALLLVVPVAIALWLSGRGSPWRSRLACGAALLFTAALLIAPVTARNAAKGGEFVLVTDSGGLNFYLGNGPGAVGTYRVPPELPSATNAGEQFEAFRQFAEQDEGRALSSKEVNAYWYGKTWNEIRSRPGAWVRLLGEKLWLFWNARELPNTHDYSFNRKLNPVLALPLVQFWWISPFAMCGLVALMWRRRGQDVIVAAFVAVQMAALVAFFVLAHYRVPVVPALIVVALLGLRFAVAAVRERQWLRVGVLAAVLAVALPVTFASKLPKSFDDEYFKLGYAYHVNDELEQAESSYQRALELNPGNISAHKNLAHLYGKQGSQEAEKRHWIEVARLARAQGNRTYFAEAQRALVRISRGRR